MIQTLAFVWIIGTVKSQTTTSAEDICEVFKDVNFKPIETWYDLELHTVAWILASIFTLITLFMSFRLLLNHFRYYYQSVFQRHIVRILLMAPLYSICSLASVFVFQKSVYFDATKNCYEAFVIYEFFVLLLSYLGRDEESQAQALENKRVARYPFPFGCIKYDPSKPSFLILCKRLCLQYIIIHPITTLIAVVTEAMGILCPESTSFNHPMIWLTYIELISVCVSMYGLVLFYIVVHDDISEHNPLAKFIVVKFVIFFSFWQSIAISWLTEYGFIRETDYYTTYNIATSLQSFLICFEMVIACFMHERAFSYKPFVPKDDIRTPIIIGIRDIFSVSDYLEEVQQVMKKDAGYDADDIQLRGGAIIHEDYEMQKSNHVREDSESSHMKGKKARGSSKNPYVQIDLDVMEAHETDMKQVEERNVNTKSNKKSKYVPLTNDEMEIEGDEMKATNIKAEKELSTDSVVYDYSFVPQVIVDDD